MSLGQAQTNSFPIGTAELRVGAMSSAGKLDQSTSVGLIDEASANIAQTTVELKGGFPRLQVASAISEQTGSVSATLREASRRNLNVMLGNGIPAAATVVETTITADLLIGDGTATVAAGAAFTVGDICVIYQDGKPESVSVVKLTAKAAGSVSFATNSLSMALQVANGTIRLYKANEVSLGNVTQVNYFAAALIQKGATGKPIVWNFWKASVGGNMDYATNSTDFASFKLELKLLQPSAVDTGVGGALNTQAAMIATNPFGMLIMDQ